MKVIFTCGGTAGHVNPALALAGMVKERRRDADILFVGANRGMERRLVEKAGWPFQAVEISNFHRSLKPKEIRHNLVSLKNFLMSPAQARAVLAAFPADLVVGTGGYASYPMVRAAAKEGIPTAVHESNAIPGLTTRLLEGCADRIMVGFESCRKNYKRPEKVLVTGTPVRGDFFTYTKKEAKAKLGLADGRPLLVSFWGSLGATEMNRQTADMMLSEQKRGCPYHHIHGAGGMGFRQMQERLKAVSAPELEVREYIDDMGTVMRAADVVICRAGASTISELTALGVPAVIVPSPNVTHNHQEPNARVLADAGGAVMLLEKDSSGERLLEAVDGILGDERRRQAMGEAMASLGSVDAAEKIYEAVMALCRNGRQ